MGAAFTPPGVSNCSTNSYFRGMFNTPTTGYWRYMGWGDIGAGPSGIIHYAYTQDGVGATPETSITRPHGQRSHLEPRNQDRRRRHTRSQWMPSLSVAPTATGHVLISWYDARNTTGDDLERSGRVSADNGATWANAEMLSDVVSPKPLQPDPNVQACYAGDYDRNSTTRRTTTAPGSTAASDRRLVAAERVLRQGRCRATTSPAPNIVHDLTTLFDDGDVIIEPGESSASTSGSGTRRRRRDRDQRCGGPRRRGSRTLLPTRRTQTSLLERTGQTPRASWRTPRQVLPAVAWSTSPSQ